MSTKSTKEILGMVGGTFNSYKEDLSRSLQEKVDRIYNMKDSSKKVSVNPFLDKDGNLTNQYIDYQSLLDNPNTNDTVKKFITEATGLVPTETKQGTSEDNLWSYLKSLSLDSSTSGSTSSPTISSTNIKAPSNSSKSSSSSGSSKTTGNYKVTSLGGDMAKLVGTKIANTSSYADGNYSCVWYVRNRIKEKLGIDTGITGNANQWYSRAKSSAQLAPTKDNIKPNTVLSYSKGVSRVGQTAGHIIFIEDVVGDTVYYTDGGGGNGGARDGYLKTTTKQGILDGVRSDGKRIGSSPVGLIDLSKY